MSKLLLVEDDVVFARMLTGFLKKQGHEIDVSHTMKDGIKNFQQTSYDLLLLDYRLPDGDGITFLKMIREQSSHVQALMMTSFHDLRTAVTAIRSGAFDYITKPVNPDELLLVLNEALAKKDGLEEDGNKPEIFIEGTSPASRQLQEYIRLVGPTEMSVVLQGESGTGKENVARTIHRMSKRASSPFIAIDCGALSSELAVSELFGHERGSFTGAFQTKKGSFEMANHGTLFLDEIGNLGYDIQIKLLRVLQERVIQRLGSNETTKVDVRIICATNDDLILAVKEGRFREDLYHRLNEFKIKLPNLCERENDLEIFIDHFIKLANLELKKSVKGFLPDVIKVFKRYDWPGNLRELRNVIRRSVLLAHTDVAGEETLPGEMALETGLAHMGDKLDLKASRELAEKEMIIKALQETRFNKSEAAKKLNIDRKTLYHKISRYNLEF